MRIDVLTLFPRMLDEPLHESLLGKAREQGLIDIRLTDIRDFTTDPHRTVDDTPYGGGAGMVLKPEPLFTALQSVKTDSSLVILATPQGERFSQTIAEDLAAEEHLVFICGHYEGFDERIRMCAVDRELSAGDFVASGGEFPVLLMIDVICRLIPGVVGNADSLVNESFSNGLLDYPVYTRPRVFQGLEVPPVLLSGDHAKIQRWRRKESLRRTFERRPDLLERYNLEPLDQRLLQEIAEEAQTQDEVP